MTAQIAPEFLSIENRPIALTASRLYHVLDISELKQVAKSVGYEIKIPCADDCVEVAKRLMTMDPPRPRHSLTD